MKNIFLSVVVFVCVNNFFAYGADENIKQVAIRCSSNQQCEAPGLKGMCQDPGQPTSKCVFVESSKIHLSVITPKTCRTCNTGYVTGSLKTIFPGLETESLTAGDEKANKFVKDLSIEMLPAYILSKNVENDPNFARFKQMADLIGENYYLKPSFSGVSYFLNRSAKPGELDLFFGVTQNGAAETFQLFEDLLKTTKMKTRLQLVGLKNPETGELLSPGGPREINEDKAFACAKKYFPAQASGYLSCRLSDINNLWIEDCFTKNKINSQKIKACVGGEEGQKLFEEKIKLSNELKISYAPLFLLENIEIFGPTPKTSAQEIINLMEPKK